MQVSMLFMCLYYHECPCYRGIQWLELSSSKNCLWWKAPGSQILCHTIKRSLFSVVARWILRSVISRSLLKLTLSLSVLFSSPSLVGPWCDLWRHRFHHDQHKHHWPGRSPQDRKQGLSSQDLDWNFLQIQQVIDAVFLEIWSNCLKRVLIPVSIFSNVPRFPSIWGIVTVEST